MVPTAPHTLGIPEACRGLFGKCHVVTQNFGTFCSEICNSICHAVVYFHYSKNLCTASSTEPSSAPSPAQHRARRWAAREVHSITSHPIPCCLPSLCLVQPLGSNGTSTEQPQNNAWVTRLFVPPSMIPLTDMMQWWVM